MTKKKTTKEYINECIQLGYDLPIEEYKGARAKIKHRCDKCGFVYKQEPTNHLRGVGCPNCKSLKLIKLSKKLPQEYVIDCFERGFDPPIEQYIKCDTKINHRCNKCGFVYKQTPSNHLKGKGCPKCKQSKGEKFIQNWLDKNNIKYEPQKKFNDLKDKLSLSYDFYLPEQKVLIEYQGAQHYESIRFRGARKKTNLKKQKFHDKLKEDYAKEHGYKLLQIYYKINTQNKINLYLDEVISSIMVFG